MKFFIAGMVVGLFWSDVKWLTYDLLKAICKGMYVAFRVALFGKLEPGFKRRHLIVWLPKLIRSEVGIYLKWEWLRGCKVR